MVDQSRPSKGRWANLTDEEYAAARKAQSESAKRRWANTSQERRDELGAAHSVKLLKYYKELDPAIQKDRNDRRSSTMIQVWENMSDEDYKAFCDAHVIIKTKYWDEMPDEERVLFKQKVSTSVQRWWTNLSQEEQLAFLAKIKRKGTKLGIIREVDGQDIYFHSTWEYPFLLVLRSLNVGYRFANFHGTKLLLNQPEKLSWNPDFIVDQYSDIFEVKGEPHARKSFYETDIPAFIASTFSQTYNLYVCEFDISRMFERGDIKSYQDLRDACKLIHSIK